MALFRKSSRQSEEPEQNAGIEEQELEVLRCDIDRANLPSPAKRLALRELKKLKKAPAGATEYMIGVNYLDYLATLPWNAFTEDNLDLNRAERILNEEHANLYHVKERILEYLAISTLKCQPKFRLLVVDDDKIARDNLAHILGKEGYEVAMAADGARALEQMEVSGFDLVLADLFMVDVGGMELLESVKSRYPNTEVIIITGYATISSAVQAMQKGACGYIAKPLKLDEVRATVAQALAKRRWAVRPRGPALCFVGPPGTGKTSLGKSIAHALGRKFVHLSLAGLKDEAELRGHRRSYVGAMPGRIIDAIRRVGSKNPVFMLDEIDKVSEDFKGDPASALLEILDPEQHESFTDYYLDVPFDLSGVMFIATANHVGSIPRPLLDRLEVLTLSGYTDEEKEHIAMNFLIPRQIKATGLARCSVQFSTAAVEKVITEHTREAGLRNLERAIASICRKIARQVLCNGRQARPLVITPREVEKYLGPRKFYYEVAEAKDRVGVTTGLVWTETGGDIIFVEATRMRGGKGLILTGSLGDVMQESAQAALSYVRTHAERLGIPEDFYERHDIHIHVPAGAVGKEGPSAGVTIAVALISLLTGRPARRDVAMTGELTLSGRVLPVAGIREKMLAARRAGVVTIVFPEKNRVDVHNVSEEIRKDLKVVFIDNFTEVVDVALVGSPAILPKRAKLSGCAL